MRGMVQSAAIAGVIMFASGCDKAAKQSAPAAPAPLRANANLPSGTLDRRALIEYAMAVRDYAPRDEFSPQSFDDAKIVGRTFHVDLDMGDPANKDLPKLFSYDTSAKALSLTLYPGPIRIFDVRKELGQDTRSNAFGASVTVKRSETQSFDIGPITDPYDYDRSKKPLEIGVFKLKTEYDTTFEQNRYSFDTLEKSIPMSPEKARETAQGLHLIFEGFITKSPNGHAIECQKTANTATISSPFEIIFNGCTLSSRLTKISIVSPRGGVLASWVEGVRP